MTLRRKLIRDATVVTMDDGLGSFGPGSVLVEGDRIAAVGPQIEAGDAEVIEADRFIVLPGFILLYVLDQRSLLPGEGIKTPTDAEQPA